MYFFDVESIVGRRLAFKSGLLAVPSTYQQILGIFVPSMHLIFLPDKPPIMKLPSSTPRNDVAITTTDDSPLSQDVLYVIITLVIVFVCVVVTIIAFFVHHRRRVLYTFTCRISRHSFVIISNFYPTIASYAFAIPEPLQVV